MLQIYEVVMISTRMLVYDFTCHISIICNNFIQAAVSQSWIRGSSVTQLIVVGFS